MHIDDILVLQFIKDRLKIGKVTVSNSSCSYKIHSFKEILNIVIPIFDKYSLLTYKQLNFKDWKKAVNLKLEAQKKGRSLSINVYDNIISIKNTINSFRINYSDYTLDSSMITDYWLLGFTEGDGSFNITNNVAAFSLTQKDKKILDAISDYFENLSISPINPKAFKPGKPNSVIRKGLNAYQLSITNIDVLVNYIIPFFERLTFHSRKNVDFKIWCLCVYIIFFGYHTLIQGKSLLRQATVWGEILLIIEDIQLLYPLKKNYKIVYLMILIHY